MQVRALGSFAVCRFGPDAVVVAVGGVGPIVLRLT
jgi:hypothetical protein